ncbi:MAG TPA: hypothetical protein VMG10_32370 [Gemmataceae bacterium]|nr:hypothetical protein [Gemmataceae bacterium]
MRTLIVSTWTVAVLFGGAARAWGQDAARALVERAVKAHGGAEALGRVRADRVRFKGTLVIQGHTTPFVAETTMQLPSKYKHVIETNSGGDKHTILQIINGSKVYITLDGRAIPADPSQLAEIRSGLELERAKRLLPLLEDKSYQLAVVEELKVNDRPAVGIRITGRGRREMRLYFDKEFGLLVRAENRLGDSKSKEKEVRQHFFFGDFKDIGGYKRATKVRAYRNGQEIMEAELLDAKVLEKVDETEFAKP